MSFQISFTLDSLQNKAKNGRAAESNVKSSTPQGNLDMREVLKGLGSVKLKTVPRLVTSFSIVILFSWSTIPC